MVVKGIITASLLLLSLITPALFAQYAQRFVRIDKSGNQNYGSTYQVLQDKYGFLWVCTTNGLVKYDGYTLKTYKHDRLDSTSLPNNEIRRIFEDTRGNLWISVHGFGLCVYQRDKDAFIRIPGEENSPFGLRSTGINTIAEDSNHMLWIGGNAGLDRFDLKQFNPDSLMRTSHTTIPTHEDRLWDEWVTCLFIDDQNSVWFGNEHGVALIDSHRNRVRHIFPAEGTKELSCYSICQDSSGVLWFGMENLPYSCKIDGRDTLIETTFAGRDFGSRSYCCVDKENRVWFSFVADSIVVIDPSGLNIEVFPTNRKTKINTEGQFLRQPSLDFAGNLWMSGGPYFQFLPYTGKRIANYTFPHEDQAYASAVIVIDSLLIAGHLIGGIVVYNMKTGRTDRYLESRGNTPGLLNNRIYSFLPLENNRILFTMHGGIQILDLHTRHIETVKVWNNLIRWAFQDSRGDFWICTEASGIFRMENHTWNGEWHLKEGERKIGFPRQILEDDNGGFWIATMRDGLVYYHPVKNTFRKFLPVENDPNSISSEKAECILKSMDGNLWIGTRNGLNKFNISDSLFTVYSISDGLADDQISSIIEDTKGALWLTNSSGVSKFMPSTGEIINYNEIDGFINPIYYPRGTFQEEDGRIWLCGINGIDAFYPEEIRKNPLPSRVVLTNFLVRNEYYPLNSAYENVKEINLGYGDNFFEFEWAALHFTSQPKIQYAYLMEGFHDDWVYINTRRTASFTDLSPGNYTFHVKASNGDEVWSDDELAIRVHILPPFYLTWWFYLLCGLTAVSVGYGIYRYRVNIIRKEARLKAEFDKKLAQVEMQALRAQMNPHFLFNSLNSVKSFIGQNKTNEAQEYLTAFAKLVRQVLNNSRQNTVRLYDDLQALELYLKLEQMRMSGKFDYSITIGDDVNPDFAEIPPLLLQPFVENAIKHGLRHKENGHGKLSVHINREGERLHFSIKDNGIGREKAHHLQSNIGKPHNSMGIRISEERMAFIRDQYGEATDYRITDLMDDEGNASGTRVDIWLPVAS